VIRALVLAAGESRRMGQPKMLLPFRDTTIIAAVAGTALASSADSVHIVLGARAEDIRAAVEGLPVAFVMNAAYRLGMLTSIQAGVRAMPAETRAVLLMLGDQPEIPAETLDRVIDAWQRSRSGFALPIIGGKRGHPLLIDMRHRDELLALSPESGMRPLLAAHADEILHVPVESDAVLRDLDTPDDYRRLTARNEGGI